MPSGVHVRVKSMDLVPTGPEFPSLLEAIVNAMPHPVFVVDKDVRIVFCNPAAQRYLGATPERILHRKGGNALHCVNASLTDGGCGTALPCSTCVVRGSVEQSIDASRTIRRAYKMQVMSGPNAPSDVHILVSTAPIAIPASSAEAQEVRLAVLMFEDIGELVALRGIVPICSGCRKVRDDEDYWQKVETFLEQKLDIAFSHGLCPECLQTMYPDLVAE